MISTEIVFENEDMRDDFFDWLSNEGESRFWDRQDLKGKPGPNVQYDWDFKRTIYIDEVLDDE